MKTEDHYRILAPLFNKLWTFSPGYVEAITREIIACLALNVNDRFVDLGCGSGLYTQNLVDIIHFSNPVLAIDSCGEMLNLLNRPNIITWNSNATDFVQSCTCYDKILLKEMIHHVPEFEFLLQCIKKQLNNNGKLLIVTWDESQSEVPLFAKAQQLAENMVMPYIRYVDCLKNLNMDVVVSNFLYPVSVYKTEYFNKLRNRYLSFLSYFTEYEIEIGIKELDAVYASDYLNYNEKYVFITGTKIKP